MDVFPFPELETDEQAIAAFVARENSRTEAALSGPRRESDEAGIRAILEANDEVPSVTRRGRFVYDFRKTPENPRGRWLRLPETEKPLPDAPWETVFDVDAFCAETGAVWVWGGAETSAFNPSRVLIRLSADGSDMTRHIEFDLDNCAPVPGGFDLGPDRGSAAWAGADSLILSSAGPGDATRSGWSGALRLLQRGGKAAEAPLMRRTDPDNLLIEGWISRLGGLGWIEVHMEYTEINMARVTLLKPGQPPIILPNPEDTAPAFNHSHCAWIANQQGPHKVGTLVLSRHDGSEVRVLFTPAAREAVRSVDVFFIGNWLIWIEMRELSPHVMALDVRDPEAVPREIVPPVAAEALWVNAFDANEDSGDGTLVLTATGFLTPAQKWLFDLSRGVEGIVFRPFLSSKARFDASGCRVELWTAISEDGAEIPYHIVLPKGHEGRRNLPVLQYGYGGFGISLMPGYDALIGKFWIETGAAYVQAYIRGGGEFGPDWHNQAKAANRHLAFADFAAVAADLVARGVTTPDRIACQGGSNGGLLCGVMLTRYPERFGAVWASVGVHDMLNFTRFPAGRGWIDEYGDPEDGQAREWLRAYSPLHNIPDRPLPPALIDTSHRDDRVDPSHSRRFAGALMAAGHLPLYIEHRGGHGGGGASYEKAREMSFGLAFLRHALRIGNAAD